MTTYTMVCLCIAAFAAGFIDSIVGGGGLIQTPASLVLLPQFPVATVIGSLKIPSFTGTSLAVLQYLRRVKINWSLLIIMMFLSFVAAYAGSLLLLKVHNDFLKPLLLLILVIVAIYTYSKKDFGVHSKKDHTPRRHVVYSILISVVIGFYDGFIGPGAGSFLILAFVSLLGFDFLKASTHAKLINLATNLGSIVLFAANGRILFFIAIPMALCNALGATLGARLALKRGNAFIRIFFLFVVTATILRFAYDVFSGK